MLDNTWVVTAVLGALNLIVIEVLKGKGGNINGRYNKITVDYAL